MAQYSRDPVSELHDPRAADLLRRCYAARGGWASAVVPAPPVRFRVRFLADGIDLDGPDPGAGDRWVRAFVRSVYYLHRWYYRHGAGLDLSDRRMYPGDSRGLRYEVSPRVRRVPGGRGFGPPVRIRLRPGGERGYAAVPPLARYTANPGLRSDPAARDWEPAPGVIL